MSVDDGWMPLNWIAVAGISLVLCFVVDSTMHKVQGIETVAILHSAIAGLGSLACWIAEVVLAADDETSREPYITLHCGRPVVFPTLTSTLPMITCGYAVFDLLVGLKMQRMDYTLHGLFLGVIMGTLCVMQTTHSVTRMLLMEVSTIFLNLRTLKKLWIDAAFALLFFLIRLVYLPYFWWLAIKAFYLDHTADLECTHPALPIAVLLGGLFFHGLNIYWGYLIALKMIKKLQGGNIDSNPKKQ